MTNKNRHIVMKKDLHKNKKGLIIAHGESGNAHAFYGEDTAEILEDGQLRINKSDDLAHEEHKHHTFEPGLGEVDIQREYSMGSLRSVTD